MSAWRLRVSWLVLWSVLVPAVVKVVDCERVWPHTRSGDVTGLKRELRHSSHLPPRSPFGPRPGRRGFQPRPEDTLALHPRHPLRLYSHRDGPRSGPHQQLGPGPRKPHQPDFEHGPGKPHQPDFEHGPPRQSHFSLGPSHQPDFEHGPPRQSHFSLGPSHQPDFDHGPPHQPDFSLGPSHQPDFSLRSPHQPDFSLGPSHQPEFGHGPPQHLSPQNLDFSVGPTNLDRPHRKPDISHESHQTEDKSKPESGCRINGQMYAPGQSWLLGDCRRGTCVKFGHNYYVSEDRCSVKYKNANYACVIYEEKERPYPDCCPYYRCNPEN